jgi:hypothetical protein
MFTLIWSIGDGLDHVTQVDELPQLQFFIEGQAEVYATIVSLSSGRIWVYNCQLQNWRLIETK